MGAEEYLSLTEGSGWLEMSGWTQLAMSGRDRATFLQGTCTNDIRKLTPGKGCEAFVTAADGKTLGHVFVFAHEDHFDIITAPGQSETLRKHWDRYIIREDVKLRDVSTERALVLVAGNEAPKLLRAKCDCDLPAALLDHVHCGPGAFSKGVREASIRCMVTNPPVFWLSVDAAELPSVAAAFAESGIVACTEESWEPLRIELGWPKFGSDITSKNLPQEVGRDQQAISFQKGCYLGQETVARIDALGHVNWKLMGLKVPLESNVQPGVECLVDGKVIARVTSVAFSPRLQSPVALAYVRRGWDKAGKQIGGAEVLALPML